LLLLLLLPILMLLLLLLLIKLDILFFILNYGYAVSIFYAVVFIAILQTALLPGSFKCIGTTQWFRMLRHRCGEKSGVYHLLRHYLN
jgi:hypothetical protein